MPEGDDPQMPGQIGLWCDRGRHQAPAGAHVHLVAHRQLVPAALGRGVLGADLRRLGVPEPHDRPAHLRARPVRVPLGGLVGEPVPVVRGACSWRCRTASSASSTRARRRSATSTRPSPAAKRSRGSPTSLGEALDALEADEVVRSALPGRHVPGVHALQARRVEAVPRDRVRLGHRGVPGHPAVGAVRKGARHPYVRYRRHHPPGRRRPTSGPR